MKYSMTNLAGLCMGLSLAAATAACGASAQGRVETPTSTTTSTSVSVKLGLPKVGNVKYDKFFNDVVELAQLVADARAALEDAPVALNKAMNVTETTDFETALKNINGKLKDKVTVTFGVGPTGADVNVVAASGVTLSPEEQAMVDAYKKVTIDIVSIPVKLAPVVPKTIDIVAQAVTLTSSAPSDFGGFHALTTLPSVIVGIGKAKGAIDGIKADVPVIIEKSKAMTVAIKSVA
jgi:hypothetical protein